MDKYFNGVYNKDVDNDFNKLEGTWLYQNGNTELLIVLQKKVQYHILYDKWNYYMDYVIGEYRLKVNGVEVVNTLSNFDIIPEIDPREHNITGRLLDCNKLPINTGAPNERKVSLSFRDSLRNYIKGKIDIRYFIEDGVQKINAFIRVKGTYILEDDVPTQMNVTDGEYVLIKQP